MERKAPWDKGCSPSCGAAWGMAARSVRGQEEAARRRGKRLLLRCSIAAATGHGRAQHPAMVPFQRPACTSETVTAVMLTMRRTVALAVRMCTGLLAPSRIGPMAMPPPAAVLSRL